MVEIRNKVGYREMGKRFTGKNQGEQNKNNKNKIMLICIAIGVVIACIILVFCFFIKDKEAETGVRDNIENEVNERANIELANIKIAVTAYPLYEFVKEVRGNYDNLTLLQENLVKYDNLEGYDLMFYMSEDGTDSWFIKRVKQLNLSNDTERIVRVTEDIEGYGDYSWVSIDNSISIVNYIAIVLANHDRYCADVYYNNAQAYINKLDELRAEYHRVISEANTYRVYFDNEDEKLKIQSLLDELNIESIVDETKEYEGNYVKFIDTYNVTSDTINKYGSYLEIMRENLKILESAIK